MEKRIEVKMIRKITLLMLVLVFGVSACGSVKSVPASGPLVHIKLPVGYVPNIQFAPLYVSIEKGYFKDAGIEL